jgi:hypothetical protein
MRDRGILIDDSLELQIAPTLDADGLIAGGLRLGNTLYQNQALILILYPGEVLTAPAVGVGISDALLDHDFPAWRRTIRQQLELDGQAVTSIQFSASRPLTIDASYT